MVQLLTASQASIHSLYTSTGSDRKLIVAWKSSRQTVHWILAACLLLSIFTSQDFSWLQNGQVNWVSNASMFFFPRFWLSLGFPSTHPCFGAQISCRSESS